MYDLQKKNWKYFSYRDWYEYFKRNDARRLKIDFSNENDLSEAEIALILPSVRAFQKGEYSEGTMFLELAKKFAADRDRPLYVDAITLFIREENFHSSYLAQYMNHYEMKMVRKNTLDKAFRFLRHKGGLFTEIAVLVTAETIALTYYTALGNVANEIGSPALASICKQMLHDELPHIVFQSYTLSHFSNNCFAKLFRKLLMEVTTGFVYAFYGKLLRAGGYSYKRFRKENMGYLKQSMDMIGKMKKKPDGNEGDK